MISTDKKSKNPIGKLFKAKSKGFTLTTDVNGMNSLFHQKKCLHMNYIVVYVISGMFSL